MDSSRGFIYYPIRVCTSQEAAARRAIRRLKRVESFRVHVDRVVFVRAEVAAEVAAGEAREAAKVAEAAGFDSLKMASAHPTTLASASLPPKADAEDLVPEDVHEPARWTRRWRGGRRAPARRPRRWRRGAPSRHRRERDPTRRRRGPETQSSVVRAIAATPPRLIPTRQHT